MCIYGICVGTLLYNLAVSAPKKEIVALNAYAHELELIIIEKNKQINRINCKVSTLKECINDNKATVSLNTRVSCIEKELDKYLDKTFMLTGFEPFTGLPYYTTRLDENGYIVASDNLANHWKSKQGGGSRFVTEQFDGADEVLDENEMR